MITIAPDMIVLDNEPSIFLAGSIEMGKAEDWQAATAKLFDEAGFHALNPRRLDWDSSWVQSIDNNQFRRQVLWEQNGLTQADYVLFNFIPGTMSPITLLELGQAISETGADDRVVVCCPEGYERKGNVDIVCRREGVTVVTELQEAIDFILSKSKD